MTRTRLSKLWDELISSYWFVPLGITIAAIGLAFGLVRLDASPEFSRLRWLEASQPESARVVLSTIAGSTITMASLSFSMTIVALTLASGHFGSRLLYNFMRSRANQFVLGTFVGIFAFCLVVLRSVRSGEDPFVPQLSVAVAVALALLGVGILIFFIHHIASSIQATSVIAAVGRDLRRTVDDLFPESDVEVDATVRQRLLDECPTTRMLVASVGGTLQAVDVSGLVEIATEHDSAVRVLRRAGDYVLPGAPLLELRGEFPAECDEAVLGCFVMGRRRTLIQDAEFALLQLVEVGVRALSPGINDPFTACGCVDELAAGLGRILGKGDIPDVALDEQGEPRVALRVPRFEGMVEAAFNQLRQHGRGEVALIVRLLEALAELVPMARRPEHVEALRAQAQAAYEAALETKPQAIDADALHARFAAFEASAAAVN